jgi:PAS domain S-box-containing protein
MSTTTRACRDIEVCAAFGVPIKVYDRIVAIAEFYAGQACQKDPWLLDVVHTTAQQLGSLLERRQAEDRFRLVVESAPNGIVMIDRTGRIVLVNSETERLFGYQRGELRGQSIEVLVPQRFQAAHPAHRAGFFTNPRPRAMGAGRDLFGLRKDGSEVPVEIGLSPLKTEQGTFVLASIVDITARKRAEDELRRTGERLRLATQIGKIGIWEWDIVGNHVTWTDSIYAIHGVTREQFVPTVEGFTQLVHPEDRQIVSRSIERSVQEGAPYEPTFRAIRPDGREIWLFTTGNVLRDASGNPLRMLGVVMDITERKKAELELAAAVQELTIRNQEMQQFVHTVSHDLKAPLITMLGFVTLLKQELRDGRTDALSDAARRIEASARKMERLIADLLQLSRIGRVKDEPSEVDVVALLGEVQELLSIQIRHSGAQIHIERDMPKLFIDRTRLMQVFENLLSNAVKYGCEGSDRRIEVGAQLSDDEVRFYIRDYGPGIPAEQREAIFGLFQRLHTDDRGTGVGLAIVAKVMQVYAGRCWVESDPGHGATFWLAFPHTLLSRPVRRASLPAHSSAGAAAAGSPPAA